MTAEGQAHGHWCECGRWAEVTETDEKRDFGWLWKRERRTAWRWMLKRPEIMYPAGFAVCASGREWTQERAIEAARKSHDEWHEWDRRQAETKRIDFGGTNG